MPRILIPTDSPPPAPPPDDAVLVSLHGLTMGTSWSVKLMSEPRHDVAALQAGMQQQLDTVVAQMSNWSDDSDLARINRAGVDEWQAVPAELFAVLSCALQVARDSGGAYDPTVGALVNLWGFGPDARRVDAPNAATIAPLLAASGWQKIELDARLKRVRHGGGMLLDLSAIAKGYGVDQVARYLQTRGIWNYLVEVGGELRGLGVKPDGQPWWVALEQPPDLAAAEPAGARAHVVNSADISSSPEQDGQKDEDDSSVVALHGLSIATSGDYRRFFEAGGRRYAHTLDPRTGAPITHQLASVTVLHPECMLADVLATALTVLGMDAGMAYAKRWHIAAAFVERRDDGVCIERFSPALEGMLA